MFTSKLFSPSQSSVSLVFDTIYLYSLLLSINPLINNKISGMKLSEIFVCHL